MILTNYHNVREATKVYVRVPGLEGSYADIHAADPRSDLAVLRLLKPPKGLKALPLGEGEKVRRGQFVLTLTNAFMAGFREGGPSASWGIVSDLRQRHQIKENDPDYGQKLYHFHGSLIQTDARLNTACGGGALLNIRGELIGMTSSLAAVAGEDAPGGFAVPMNSGMRRIVDTLKAGSEVEYGFLGIRFGQALRSTAPTIRRSRPARRPTRRRSRRTSTSSRSMACRFAEQRRRLAGHRHRAGRRADRS